MPDLRIGLKNRLQQGAAAEPPGKDLRRVLKPDPQIGDSATFAQKYWVYILECTNGSYYTGYTTDLERRYQEHLQGTAKCKYTRAFKPIKIAAAWEFASKEAAMQREYQIKQLSRTQKIKLLEQSGG